MGLEINRLSKGDEDMAGARVATARVYRTVDGHFVGEGDPRGAYLAYAVGAEIQPGDQNRYDKFTQGEPQDALDSEAAGAMAYTDDAVRDDLRRRQAGDVSARTPLNHAPPLIHDRLATELADEAQARAAMDPSDLAALRNEGDGDEVYAEHEVWRTEGGDLVHAGDEAGTTLAYPVGARIDDADVDEYNDLGDAPSDETPPAAPKKAAVPANKSARKPADK